MTTICASIRVLVATFAVCVLGYTACVLGCARLLVPGSADGSLIRLNGRVAGSRLIGQQFEDPRFFWSRPSAVGYDSSTSGGSNKSPTGRDVLVRAQQSVVQHGASPEKPLPLDLATASGSGLDPHISEGAARYQVERVARARGLDAELLEDLIDEHCFSPGGWLTAGGRLINVLQLNLALEQAGTSR